MSMQQVLQPMVTAMRLTIALRQLRNAEMIDARRWLDVFGRASDEAARAFIERHVGEYVARARKHNRRLVQVQRKLRLMIENGTTGSSTILTSFQVKQDSLDTIRRAVRL